MQRISLLFALILIVVSVHAHTHDFSSREVQSFIYHSEHAFMLANRNSFTSNFAFSIDDIEVSIIENLSADESVPVTWNFIHHQTATQ
ncbi:hypothetical protein C9980_12805 [Vibrio mediterranei]|nr:hypothetical protein C9980_12805 [Vibrio mediterranei]